MADSKKKSKHNRKRGANISQGGHMSWLDNIRQKLGKDKLKIFESSCFGHMLSIPDIKFQGQLFHVLIRNMESDSFQRLRMSFHINHKRIEFGPEEFALMTGLRFDKWEDEVPDKSNFHRNFFHGKRNLKFIDVETTFFDECQETGGCSDNSLRLAYLYVLYGILLAGSRKSINIPLTSLKYIHLVEDLDKFNTFPWGHVAYEFLVRSSHKAKVILEDLEKENKALVIDANGFTDALQTWAYEVMPELAKFCANKVPGAEDRLPRMLRWSATCHPTFEKVNAFFKPDQTANYPVCMDTSYTESLNVIDLGVDRMESGPLLTNARTTKKRKLRSLTHAFVKEKQQRNEGHKTHEGADDVQLLPEINESPVTTTWITSHDRGIDVPRGWPFGLGNMNSRIVVAEASQPAATVAAPPLPNVSRILRSSSFSSFSSSNLDTESTGSFFPDQSVSLGRLIGIQPVNKGRLLHLGRRHGLFPDERCHPGSPKGQENSQGICAPLLHRVRVKMGRSGSSKRH